MMWQWTVIDIVMLSVAGYILVVTGVVWIFRKLKNR